MREYGEQNAIKKQVGSKNDSVENVVFLVDTMVDVLNNGFDCVEMITYYIVKYNLSPTVFYACDS